MGRQILLIDDSAMLRRIAANVLRAQPARYEVVAATRASEGFARACGGEPVVIIVDERLGGAENADFCRRLLDEPRTSGVPVVLLTSKAGEAASLESFPGNVVETLRKPFAPEQLASLVNAITNLARKGTSLTAMRLALHPNAEAGNPLPATDRPQPPEKHAKSTVPGPRPLLPIRESSASIRAAVQTVAVERLTGSLRFCPADGIPTELFVDNGRFLLVTTRDGAAYSDKAEDVLPAKVSPATLQEAAAEQSATGVPFLLTLGARGLVSKTAAVELLHRFGQRHFSRLWTVPAKSLHVAFHRTEALPGFALRVEPRCETVDEWLLGTLRSLTGADLASEARHQGLVGTPRFQRWGEAILKDLELDDTESEFIRRVNGHDDFPTIARSLGLRSEEAFLLLHRFRCLDVLEYRPAPLPFVVTPRTKRSRVLPLRR